MKNNDLNTSSKIILKGPIEPSESCNSALASSAASQRSHKEPAATSLRIPFQKIDIENQQEQKLNKIDVLAMEEYGSPLQVKGKKQVTPVEELEESLTRMRGCFEMRNQPNINNFDGESTA